ncbi:MAG: DUF3343 domain-containing protein [Candidatus Melainabacteria bacterium]|nr:DUF3343 domain-containing protein [Candidatus Melainabacteria bacterium]
MSNEIQIGEGPLAMRIILTFETTHAVLAAEKALRSAKEKNFRFRPTPTPPGLTDAVCGMALEVLAVGQRQDVVEFLSDCQLTPHGVFEIDR